MYTETEHKDGFNNDETMLKFNDMRKTILFSVLLLCGICSYGQDNVMKIYRTNGDVLKLMVHEIDSVLFESNNEEDLDTITPVGVIAEESFWKDESDYRAVLSSMYIKAREFARYQIYVEDLLLKIKRERGEAYRVQPSESFVSSLWTKGYIAINTANILIKYSKGNPEYKEFYEQGIVMRAFIYYNMAMLWNNIPYVTDYEPEDSGLENIQQTSSVKIFQESLNLLSGINLTSKGCYFLSNEATEFLKLEIRKAIGEANANLPRSDASLVFMFGEVQDYLSQIIGEVTNIYTIQYLDFLNEEAFVNKQELVAKWQNMEIGNYGYWAMLKRNGIAREVSGLRPHELVLPVPAVELKMNSSLIQNPGYDE